jgi:hypothetical protein
MAHVIIKKSEKILMTLEKRRKQLKKLWNSKGRQVLLNSF